MDKKRITECLIKALAIVFAQMIYIKFFGKVNILVGMIMAMAAISFLQRDLTNSLLYRAITFLGLNIILVISSYLSFSNVWLGLIINFLTLFITTYIYMNDFRMPTSYIFLMLYIFMWSTPIKLEQLPTRILAITFGVGLIIISQVIFNKNKFKNDADKIIKEIINDIKNQIEDVQNDNFNTNKNTQINKKIRSLLTLISSRSHRKIYHSRYEINKFNIAVYLERLNLIINNVTKFNKSKEVKNEYLEDLKKQINNMDLFNEDKKNINEINKDIDEFIDKYENVKNKPLFLWENIYLLKIFEFNINNKGIYKDKKLNKIYETMNISSEFELINSLKENLNFKSLKLIYSLKLALSISLTMFLVQFFEIEYGKWILITLYVIMQPYGEDTIAKAKKRFRGTLIGVIIFSAIFSLIHDSVPKMIILGIAFFYYFYFKEYDKKVIAMTIVSLSSVSLVDKINILSVNRLICIGIGIGIGLIFSKYFLPYDITDSIKELKLKYKKNNKLILIELNKVRNGKGSLDKLIKLSLISNQIENKLITNNAKTKDNHIDELIYKHSEVMSDFRFLLFELYYRDNKHFKLYYER